MQKIKHYNPLVLCQAMTLAKVYAKALGGGRFAGPIGLGRRRGFRALISLFSWMFKSISYMESKENDNATLSIVIR